MPVVFILTPAQLNLRACDWKSDIYSFFWYSNLTEKSNNSQCMSIDFVILAKVFSIF